MLNPSQKSQVNRYIAHCDQRPGYRSIAMALGLPMSDVFRYLHPSDERDSMGAIAARMIRTGPPHDWAHPRSKWREVVIGNFGEPAEEVA